MGILATDDYVDCSASDLIGQHVGQTGPKVKDKLRQALGRVLFVDEAYGFCDGGFGKEAVNELVDCLTKPEFMNKLIVILAGYTDDMNKLLKINPGLSSRFPEEVIFTSMQSADCVALLKSELSKQGFQVDKSLDHTLSLEYRKLEDGFGKLSALDSWGNGRDVKNLAKSIGSRIFASPVSSSGNLTATAHDIIKELEKMLEQRISRDKVKSPTSSNALLDLLLPQMTMDPPDPRPSIYTAKTTAVKAQAKMPAGSETVLRKDESHNKESAPGRDPGVSDQIWDSMQFAMAAERTRQMEVQKQLQQEEQIVKEQHRIEEAKLTEIRRLEELQRHADEERKQELQRQLDEEQRRQMAALKARQEAEERLRRAREEEERKRQKELAIQRKLNEMGVCVAGFQWIKQPGGYRCAGGSHYIGNTQLGL